MDQNFAAMALSENLQKRIQAHQDSTLSKQSEESSCKEQQLSEELFGGLDKVNTKEKRSYLDALVKKNFPDSKKNVFN